MTNLAKILKTAAMLLNGKTAIVVILLLVGCTNGENTTRQKSKSTIDAALADADR